MPIKTVEEWKERYEEKKKSVKRLSILAVPLTLITWAFWYYNPIIFVVLTLFTTSAWFNSIIDVALYLEADVKLKKNQFTYKPIKEGFEPPLPNRT